jgi:hypothetical protein
MGMCCLADLSDISVSRSWLHKFVGKAISQLEKCFGKAPINCVIFSQFISGLSRILYGLEFVSEIVLFW